MSDAGQMQAGATQNAGQSDTSWLTGVEPDVAKFITDKTVKSLPDLAKGYVEAQRALSTPRPFELPKEGDAEGMKKLHAALGVPEAPDKYEFGDLAKAMKPEELAQWSPEFHKLGLSSKQAQGLIGLVQQRSAAAQEAAEKAFGEASTQALAKLKSEWGNDYEKNYDMASRGLQALAKELGGLTPEQVTAIEKSIGTRAVHQMGLILGRHMVEAKFVAPDGQSRSMTPEAAKARRSEIARDRDFYNGNAARRPALQAEWEALGRIINQ